MALDLQEQWFRGLTELRYAATPKRLRAFLGGHAVLDTRDALLVYEPRRVVPWYAVPPGDLSLDLTEHDPLPVPELGAPVMAPRHNDWHTVPGRSLHLEGHGEVAFRPEDPDLGGRVVLHWDPFEWVEEDEPVMGHPHDPFKRIDVLRSSRHVRVEVGGSTVAESSRPMMLIETSLPVRWYLPRQDVRMDLLAPSEKHTVCAYKGVASYLSADGAPDVAWFYPDPLHDALPVKDLVCFWRPAAVYVDEVSVDTSMPGDASPSARMVAERCLAVLVERQPNVADGRVTMQQETPVALGRRNHDLATSAARGRNAVVPLTIRKRA